MNELQDKIESQVVTRTFHVSGMPESVFREIDEFCRVYYGDSRWNMIADLHRTAKEDFKFQILYDELQDVRKELAELKKPVEEPVKSRRDVPTMGKRSEE